MRRRRTATSDPRVDLGDDGFGFTDPHTGVGATLGYELTHAGGQVRGEFTQKATASAQSGAGVTPLEVPCLTPTRVLTYEATSYCGGALRGVVVEARSSVVEHYLDTVGVVGSTPIAPTE